MNFLLHHLSFSLGRASAPWRVYNFMWSNLLVYLSFFPSLQSCADDWLTLAARAPRLTAGFESLPD